MNIEFLPAFTLKGSQRVLPGSDRTRNIEVLLASTNLCNNTVNPVNPLFKAVNATDIIYYVNRSVIAVTHNRNLVGIADKLCIMRPDRAIVGPKAVVLEAIKKEQDEANAAKQRQAEADAVGRAAAAQAPTPKTEQMGQPAADSPEEAEGDAQ